MRRIAMFLVLVVGCGFDLPEAGIDAPVDGGGDASTDAPAAQCPAEYVPLAGQPAGHVYRNAPASLSWTGQDDFCRSTSVRAYLAVPDDATELTNLHTLASGTFWVGISDRITEGVYVLSIGSLATFLPWAVAEPDNAGGGAGQDCVAATATTLSTEDCLGGAANRPAVCECEP